MIYANSNCKYTEKLQPVHAYVFAGPCVMCGEKVEVTIPGTELFAYNQGAHIQDAMPSVSADDREFLMTGICKGCFSKIFDSSEE